MKLLSKSNYITISIAICTLLTGYFYHTAVTNRHQEQLVPEIDANYKYFYNQPKTEHKFIVENTGSIDCTNIWAEEEIYLIIDGKVYESNDTPHFNYFIYNGSSDSIWNLKKEKNVEVKINPLQITAFDLLKENFKPIIITKWKFIYSKENSSKKYFYEKYFIFDFHDRIFKELDSYVGGKSYINKINGYLSFGPNRYIDIFVLTGNFEINPPRAFLVMKDFSILPLNLWTKLKIEDFNNSRLFYPGGLEIQPSDDIRGGFLFYDWCYENGKIVKEIIAKDKGGVEPLYYKAWPMPLVYLSKEDEEKVIKNPEILKYFCYIELNFSVKSGDTAKKKEKSNQQEPQDKQNKAKEHYKYIMDKAEEKYLSEKNN